MPTTLLFALPLLLASSTQERSGDWPQYNGAAGDRTSTERIGQSSWSESGPSTTWRVPTEAGFSSFVIADGRALTLVARDLGDGPRETCIALDLATGEELWASEPLAGCDYDGGGGAGADGNKGGDGPRSTPSVDDGRVYVFDQALQLVALDAASGDLLWSQDLLADFGGRNIRWQNAASPLVEGDLVFVAGGGEGRSLLAFDKRTGELAWAAGDELMTHATPSAATIHGVRQVIFYVQSGLVAVDPATGAELWRTEYPYRTSSAASPVVYEDMVYVSAGYGVGAGVFRIDKTADGLHPELLWQQRNKLINHWSTPVVVDGYLYGMYSFKEYGDGPLACVYLKTGATLWSTEGFGPGNVIAVGDHLVALSDAGDVVLVEATPDEYREVARAELLEGKCWSSPSFADGQLYLRSSVEGVRVDLSAQATD